MQITLQRSSQSLKGLPFPYWGDEAQKLFKCIVIPVGEFLVFLVSTHFPERAHAGGGVSSCPGVQAGPRGVATRAGETVDVLPEGPTQLLRPRRLPLLLQPAALHQPRHQDARQGHHPGGLLYAL